MLFTSTIRHDRDPKLSKSKKVLAYRLSRWDHQLLQTHGVSTTAYASAKLAHDQLGRANTAATRAAREAALLAEKRKLIAKLEELRAAAGQVMRNNPRVAGAAVAASSASAEKARAAMLKETARSHRKMQRILA